MHTIPEIPLSAVLEDYFLIRRLVAASQYEMGRVVGHFANWLAREATTADLEDRLVSQWLVHLESKYAPRGVANHRTSLLCLWRFASQQYQGVMPPRKVRLARRPDPCPVAWTREELAAVLDRCQSLRGTFRRTGALRSAYCTTLVRFSYESGLRRSDVWRIRRDQIRPDGTIVMRQHKTGHSHWPRIRPATVAGLRGLPGDPPLRCPYSSPTDFYHFWRDQVIAPAGVRAGALQQLRRTGATWLATEHPEAVQRYLGHRTAIMQRHYVDLSLAQPQQHMPPEIVIGGA